MIAWKIKICDLSRVMFCIDLSESSSSQEGWLLIISFSSFAFALLKLKDCSKVKHILRTLHRLGSFVFDSHISFCVLIPHRIVRWFFRMSSSVTGFVRTDCGLLSDKNSQPAMQCLCFNLLMPFHVLWRKKQIDVDKAFVPWTWFIISIFGEMFALTFYVTRQKLRRKLRSKSFSSGRRLCVFV